MTQSTLELFPDDPSLVEHKLINKTELKGSTLFLPSPNSIGFLDALALDLLIQSMSMTRIAILSSPFLVGCAGFDSYSTQPDIYTAMDLFSTADGKTLALQIRSPIIKGYSARFASQLSTWIQSQDFARVVLLTGSDSARRIDSQIQSSPLRFIAVNDHLTSLSLKDLCIQRNVKEMERIETTSTEILHHDLYLPPGSGSCNLLLREFKTRQLPSLCLSWFASDGDNMLAAHEFTNAVNGLFTLTTIPVESISKPASWNLLYGSERFTRELY